MVSVCNMYRRTSSGTRKLGSHIMYLYIKALGILCSIMELVCLLIGLKMDWAAIREGTGLIYCFRSIIVQIKTWFSNTTSNHRFMSSQTFKSHPHRHSLWYYHYEILSSQNHLLSVSSRDVINGRPTFKKRIELLMPISVHLFNKEIWKKPPCLIE